MDPHDVALRVGVSTNAITTRMRALEEAGIIRGYHADTDRSFLGWPITFYAIVGLMSQNATDLSAFEQLVASWREVRECHMVCGGGDFLLRIIARDTNQQNELTEKLVNLPSVRRLQTFAAIRTSRRLTGVPL
jgi:DNA-binding Lrp family transcriptional regulator